MLSTFDEKKEVGLGKPRLLLTQSAPQVSGTVEALASMGVASMIEPMLTTRDVAFEHENVADADALIFTSANGVDSFLARSSIREGTRTYVVGPQTAARLASYGYKNIRVGDGDAESLLQLLFATWRPSDGEVVHVSGRHVKCDIAAELRQREYRTRRLVTYEAEKAQDISDEAISAVGARTFAGVVFVSRRAAETFCSFSKVKDILGRTRSGVAFCLSPYIAEGLDCTLFGRVISSARPTRDAMLRTIDTHLPTLRLNVS